MQNLKGEDLLIENKTLLKDIEADVNKGRIYYEFNCEAQYCEIVNSSHVDLYIRWMQS